MPVLELHGLHRREVAPGVLTQRFEHPETARLRSGIHHEHGFVDEIAEPVQEPGAGVPRHRLHRIQLEPALERGQFHEQPSLAGAQQVEAPLDRGAHGLVPLRKAPAPVRKKIERALQSRLQLVGREYP
jgi:hypothetical protein